MGNHSALHHPARDTHGAGRAAGRAYLAVGVLLSIYLGIHLWTFTATSKIDIVFAGFMLLSLPLFFSPILARITFLRVLRANVAILFSAFLLIELLFATEIVVNVAIRPITLKSLVSPSGQVETLAQNPWYKFRAGTFVTSRGYRGRDFEYTWKTDQYGFKNNAVAAADRKYSFLALGDSFTEGMGVSVDDTWPSLAEKLTGKRFYNAGVQGYAPSQFWGALNLLKDKLEFESVIIGHFPAIYGREKNFISVPTAATGGIESIRQAGGDGLVIPQLLKHIARVTNRALAGSNVRHERKDSDGRDWFSVYENEIPKTPVTKDRIRQNANWSRAIDAYKRIAGWCAANGKKLFIVAFPERYEVYFEPSALGLNSAYDSRYYIELAALKEDMEKMEFVLIDTYPSLKKSTQNPERERLPYLKQDAHMSRWGNRIVAEDISRVVMASRRN